MIYFRCSFLFSLVVVVQTSIPDITLVWNEYTNELHCVIANDTSNSAITFVGDAVTNEAEIEYELPENICTAHQHGDPFQCVEHQPHIKKYTRENSTHGFAGHVLDRRWEAFRTVRTPKGQYAFPEVVDLPNHDFKIAFSVRVKEDGHILLCDGDKPQESHCYWIILAGWGGKKTAMRRCEKEIPMAYNTYPVKCFKPIVEKNTSNLISLSKWSHFRIELIGSVISLYKFGDNDPTLTYTDGQPIKLRFLAFRSPLHTGCWKLHQYNFMEVAGDVSITTTSLHIPTRYQPRYQPTTRCVAIFLKLCPKCKVDITILDGKSRLAGTIFERDLWTEIQLRIPSLGGDIRAQIKASMTNGEKWYMGEILECAPDDMRKITTDKSSGELCCYVVRSGHTICKKENTNVKITSTVAVQPDCLRNTTGSRCIPYTLFKNCDNYKYCQYTAEKTIECYCPKGLSGKNCLEKCNNKAYGDQCTKTCNGCLTGCSHDDGRCEISGCKDTNLYGDYCQSFRNPVVTNNPELVGINHTNITLKLNPNYIGQVTPSFFKIQLKNSTGVWSDVAREVFSQAIKLVTINNLMPDTDYSVRILLGTPNGDVYQVDEFIPISNFTTTCQELSSDMIKVKVNGRFVRLEIADSLETCNIKNYRGYRLLAQNDQWPEWPIWRQDWKVPGDIPLLRPCLPYTFEIIKKQPATKDKSLFKYYFKTGNNTSEIIQCPEIVELKDTSVILKWDYYGDNPIKYEISYQKHRNKHCKDDYPDNWSKPFTVQNANATINNLDPYTSYIVQITPTGIAAKNVSKHIEFDTTASDNLKEESLDITHTQDDNKLAVTAQVLDCTKVTGPLELTLELKCESVWCTAEDSHVYNKSNFTYSRIPFRVNGLTNYSLLSTIRRKNSENKKSLRLTSSATAPGPVIHPVIYSKTETSMSFRWRPPYPPMGKLANYRIKYQLILNQNSTLEYSQKTADCKPKECILYPDHHCCSIANLVDFGRYYIKICAMNERPNNCRTDTHLTGRSMQEKPNPPASLEFCWKNFSTLTLKFKHPDITNGPLTSYSISMNGTQYVNETIHHELPFYTHELHNIEPAKILPLRVTVSNEAGESIPSVQNETISPPPTPAAPKLLDVDATKLTIGIPTLKLPNEVTCSILVFVIDKKSTDGPPENEKKIFDDYNVEHHGYKSWIAIDTTLQTTNDDYWNIIIGTTAEPINTEANLPNYKLNSDTEYDIIIVITTTFRNICRKEKYTFTEKTKVLESEGDSSNLYFLALLIVPIVCGICFIIIRRNGTQTTELKRECSRNNIDDLPLTLMLNNGNPGSPTIAAVMVSSIFSRPTKIAQLEEYIKTSFAKHDFEEQFETIPQGKTKPWAIGAKLQNKRKNRDANIIAYDHTRVILKMEGSTSDYINANYIKGCNGDKTYIAAQAPMLNTLNDFWRMIWQESVKYIIVLATELEIRQKVITMYWPDKVGARVLYDDIQVQCTNIIIYRNLEERTFELVYHDEIKTITQYHFLSWTKSNIFSFSPCLTAFLRHSLGIVEERSPILVHCTDGVGRTGVFILAHICLQTATKSDQVDILFELFKLREQRVNMVKSVEGYKLVHLLLLRSLVVPKTDINCNREISESVTTLLESHEVKSQLSYIDRTMWQDKLMLSIEKKTSCTDRKTFINENNYVYIDTYYVQGYMTSEKFTVTPYPLNDMTEDLWQIIIQRKITTIICLNELLKADKLNPFYPNDDQPIIKLNSGMKLHCIAKHDKKALCTYHIKVTSNDKGAPFDVRLMEFKDWFYNILCPTDVNDFLTLITDLNANDNNEPILIACRDGIRASGLFTAMYFLVQQIKYESRIDVPLAVRVVRLSKKEFIRDLAQFEFLYRCCLRYLRLCDNYANYTDLLTISLGEDNAKSDQF